MRCWLLWSVSAKTPQFVYVHLCVPKLGWNTGDSLMRFCGTREDFINGFHVIGLFHVISLNGISIVIGSMLAIVSSSFQLSIKSSWCNWTHTEAYLRCGSCIAPDWSCWEPRCAIAGCCNILQGSSIAWTRQSSECHKMPEVPILAHLRI